MPTADAAKSACYDSSHIRGPAMEQAVASAKIFRFGLFEADAANGTLTRNGVRLKIQDQPFRVLVLLLERPGEIVSRDELRQRLWSQDTFVDFDGSLNVILKKLRAAIDDDSDNPRFIETVPRRGYRFIAPVSAECKPPKADPVPARPIAKIPPAPERAAVSVPPSAPPPAAAPRQHVFIYAIAAGVLVLLCAGLLLWRYQGGASHHAAAPVQVRRSIAVLGFHSLTGKAEDAWLATAL